MSLYVDTSAVAKALRLEPGHETVAAALRDPDRVATSVISYAETCAALARSSAAPGLIAGAREELERIHLAAALVWAASVATPVTFVSWDREQRDAARAEGFALLPDVL